MYWERLYFFTMLRLTLLLFLLNISYAPAAAATEIKELVQMSLEDLMRMEVTSVAKKSQPFSDTDAAIYVITNEQIKRAGASTIPELLRLVPGLHVAQANDNTWAITSRGFNGVFASKLLVLIDGRVVYTTIFSGVYWDVQDSVLEDIDRIEVIRGPGGTLWGENAVNGVINIITKNAKNSQGGLASTMIDKDSRSGSLRYGATLAENLFIRAYMKYREHDGFPLAEMDSTPLDGRDLQQAGFRLDYDLNSYDSLRLQGDIYSGEAGQITGETSLAPPFNSFLLVEESQKGGNILLKFQRQVSTEQGWSVQTFFDHTSREVNTGLRQQANIFDIEFQHQFQLGEHNFTWGANYRNLNDALDNTFVVAFTPTKRVTDLAGLFIQDAYWFGAKTRLTLGSKFSWNSFTGHEYQPNIRLLYKYNDKHSFWGAISRAVQIPSRSFSDIRLNFAVIPGPVPTLLSIEGSKDIDSIKLTAFELGYRGQWSPRLTLDLNLFYNRYSDLISQEVAPRFESTPPPAHFVISRVFDNLYQGESYGLELYSGMQLTDSWRLTGSFNWIDISIKPDAQSNDLLNKRRLENTGPEYQFQLQSQWNINSRWSFDTSVYYVDKLREFAIPDYTRMDIKLSWREKAYRFMLGVKNLTDAGHREFTDVSGISVVIPRTLFLNMVMKF